MKREENLKYWKQIFFFFFFQYLKIHKKFKQHSINIKNYTAHSHDMVHIPAKFQENTSMRFWATVRKLNVTDRQTDRQTDGRGALQYLPSRAFGAVGDNKNLKRNTPIPYPCAKKYVALTPTWLKGKKNKRIN